MICFCAAGKGKHINKGPKHGRLFDFLFASSFYFNVYRRTNSRQSVVCDAGFGCAFGGDNGAGDDFVAAEKDGEAADDAPRAGVVFSRVFCAVLPVRRVLYLAAPRELGGGKVLGSGAWL